MIDKITIYYAEEDINKWKSKSLLKDWKKKYPTLIQDHLFDILNTRESLNLYCFGELFTGVFFAKQGYKFLYEPWIENFLLIESKKLTTLQLRFQDVFIQYAGKNLFQYITQVIAKQIKKGQPDLFIYNRKECFFVEVKKKGDILRPEQKIFIRELEKYPDPLPIRIVSLVSS